MCWKGDRLDRPPNLRAVGTKSWRLRCSLEQVGRWGEGGEGQPECEEREHMETDMDMGRHPLDGMPEYVMLILSAK